MNKLMIAAAIVCAAVFAQAASIDWSVGSGWTLQGGAKAAKGSTVYIINASAQAAIIDAINAGTFTEETAGVLGTAVTSNTKGAVASATATSKALTAGTSYDYKLLVFDTTSVSGSTYYNITAAQSKAAYDKGDPVYSENTSVAFTSGNFTTSATGWTKVSGGGDVPEPTSAMLLVLGVAGLALRRRRA